MGKGNNRIVYRNENHQWANKPIGSGRASSLRDTQREAAVAAKGMLQSQASGELITKGLHGKITSKDTIPSRDDLCPPGDKED